MDVSSHPNANPRPHSEIQQSLVTRRGPLTCRASLRPQASSLPVTPPRHLPSCALQPHSSFPCTSLCTTRWLPILHLRLQNTPSARPRSTATLPPRATEIRREGKRQRQARRQGLGWRKDRPVPRKQRERNAMQPASQALTGAAGAAAVAAAAGWCPEAGGAGGPQLLGAAGLSRLRSLAPGTPRAGSRRLNAANARPEPFSFSWMGPPPEGPPSRRSPPA